MRAPGAQRWAAIVVPPRHRAFPAPRWDQQLSLHQHALEDIELFRQRPVHIGEGLDLAHGM